MSTVQEIKPQGYFRINDIVFDIPPQSIQVIKRENNFAIPALRSTSPIKVKSGQKDIIIMLNLVFATGYNFAMNEAQEAKNIINKQLAPLIIQTRKCPFCSIDNEKIRKELAGEMDSEEVKNIAACIQGIRVTYNTQSPDTVNCLITMKFFNYWPYSPNFKYVGKDGPVDSPEESPAYKEFYQNSTFVNDKYINAINGFGKELEIIYKDYQFSKVLGKNTTGWTKLDDKHVTKLMGDDIYYRYQSYYISGEGTRHEGELIPVQLELNLTTYVPSIPVLGHTLPTAQFLGAANMDINISLFANADVDIDDGFKPCSSTNLSELSHILETVNRNSIKFRQISRRDPIYVRNPLLRLAKYDLYKNASFTYIGADKKTIEFDQDNNDFVGCIVNELNSNTVPNLPFCNTVDISLSENIEVDEAKARLANEGLSVDILQEAKNALAQVAKDFNFRVSLRSFTLSYPQNMTPGHFSTYQKMYKDVAKPLRDYLNNYMVWEVGGNTDVMKFLTNDDINLIPKELRSEWLTLKDAREKKLISISNNLTNILNSDPLPSYQWYLKRLATINTTTASPCYPDMKLPNKDKEDPRSLCGKNPDFYWQNYSDQYSNYIRQAAYAPVIEEFGKVYKMTVDAMASPKTSNKLAGSEKVVQLAPPLLAVGNGNKIDQKESSVIHDFSVQGQTITLAAAIKNIESTSYTMRRAMPTFKLYFLDESVYDNKNSGENVWRNFADFYNVNKVKEIRLIKNKDVAPDLLILHVTNLENDLVNTDFPTIQKDDNWTVNDAHTVTGSGYVSNKNLMPKKDEKIKQLMLSQGTRVQLRLGYDSDPDNLTVEFNGKVTEVSGSDVLEITSQSLAVELIADEKGSTMEGKWSYSVNSESNDLAARLLKNDCNEVESFGDKGRHSTFADCGPSTWFNGLNGIGLAENLFFPSIGYSGGWDAFRGAMTAVSLGFAISSFFPPAGLVIGVGVGIWKISKAIYHSIFNFPFTVYKQTAWDTLQELSLRHPDTIVSAVPYDTRMTLFAGYPEQLYLYRGPNLSENMNNTNTTLLGSVLSNRVYYDRVKNTLGSNPALLSEQALRKTIIKPYRQYEEVMSNEPKLEKSLDYLLKYMKPFRNYHIITSEHDIISNNMRCNGEANNAVKVIAPKDSSDANFDGSVGFENYEESTLMKADDDIEPRHVKTGTFVFHNAIDWGEIKLRDRYALSLLVKSMKKIYQGEIVILGRPGIKPHDIVFIFDTYNQIFGAVEVEQVVQTFSYDTGFITEITPNLLVFNNNLSGMAQIKALWAYATALFTKNMELAIENRFTPDAVPGYGAGKQVTEGAIDLIKNPLRVSAANRVATAVADVAKSGSDAVKAAAKSGYASYGNAMEAARYNAFLEGAEVSRMAKLTLAAEKLAVPVSEVAASSASKLAFPLAKTLMSKGPLILVSLFADDIVDTWFKWSKYRQPISVLPVKRNGENWTLGLYGAVDNTDWEKLKQSLGNAGNRIASATGIVVNKILGNRLNIGG